MAISIDLVARTEVDAQALVDLLNRAYERYEILREPRITLEGFLAEAQPESEFLLARDEGVIVGCAMVHPADAFFAATTAAASDQPDWLDCSHPTSSAIDGDPVVPPAPVPFVGDLADALYFGLAAADRGVQNRGIGRRLVERAEVLAAARGYRRLVLTTLREFGLQAYYERFGYRLVGSAEYPAGHWSITVPHHYCYMEKPLGNGITILRLATASDHPAITRLVNAAFEVESFFVTEPRTSEAEVHASALQGAFLVAEEARGALAGAVHVSLDGHVGRFGMLSTAPSAQRQGLGQRMVAEAERYLGDRGASVSEITVVNAREELFPWYRKLGYRIVGTEPYPAGAPTLRPVHFVVMQKHLVAPSTVED